MIEIPCIPIAIRAIHEIPDTRIVIQWEQHTLVPQSRLELLLQLTAYRSTAILTAAPVAVPVIRAQPKIVTFGKQSAPSSPIPAVPELTAEKVAEAERARATAATASEEQKRQSNAELGINIPISIVPDQLRLSTISSISSVSARSNRTSTTSGRPPVLSVIDVIPESPILGKNEPLPSLPPSPGIPSQGLEIVLTPPTDSIHEDQRDSQNQAHNDNTGVQLHGKDH